MPYDQALADHDGIETLTCEQRGQTASPASTAEIVAMLHDLSRATREHFRTKDDRCL